MTYMKIVLSLSAALTLTACLFETPNQRTTREAQFNGKTVAEVTQLIGPPARQTEKVAVWDFEETRTTIEAIYEGVGPGDGQTFVAFEEETRIFKCVYTATLENRRIATSSYEGNTCRYFFPRVIR